MSSWNSQGRSQILLGFVPVLKKTKQKSLSSLGASQISSSGTDHSEICHLPPPFQYTEQGVCHTVALPFTLKSILRQREELWELKYFTMQKFNLPKIL
jgi:hypothetical protein